jgi:hypothetical protein
VLKKRTFEHVETVDVPSAELALTLHHWKRTNLRRWIVLEDGGNYDVISVNLQTTVEQGSEPLVIEKREDHERSLMIHVIVQGRPLSL